MTVQFSRKPKAVLSASAPTTGSSLVRRLARARNDPAKERIRKWLIDIDDAKLQSGLGLTLEDIAVLRGWYATKSASASRSLSQPARALANHLREVAGVIEPDTETLGGFTWLQQL
jgi:hypothetical protein